MNIKISIILILLSQSIMAEEPQTPATSVSITNLTELPKEIWISGSYRQMKANTGITHPCNAGEQLEIQIDTQINYLQCGDYKEIK
ncbi:MAG: hypothetical protein ABNH16_05015 [Thalassolituus sp.]|jgi:hypothetical protein